MSADRHLAESTLCAEDVLVLGHTAVWGSLWEPAEAAGAGRWGFACCGVFQRDSPCTREGAVVAPPESAAADEESLAVSDGAGAAGTQELQLREAFDGPAGAFVVQVVRYLLQEWRTRLSAKDPELLGAALFCKPGDVDKAEAALRPLLQLLQRVDTRLRREKLTGVSSKPKVLTEREDWECPHCKYQNQGQRTECRKCKKADENFEEPDEFPQFEELLSGKVERVAAMAAARDYRAASETYLELTIGSTRWRTDVMGLTDHGAPTRKARAAQGHMRRQAAAMSPMDTEEGRLYLLWLKRLLAVAQLLRPSPDLTRNMAQ